MGPDRGRHPPPALGWAATASGADRPDVVAPTLPGSGCVAGCDGRRGPLQRGHTAGRVDAAGIPRRPRGGRHRYPELTDRAWLRRRYLEEEASPAAIAAELGCSVHSVRRA